MLFEKARLFTLHESKQPCFYSKPYLISTNISKNAYVEKIVHYYYLFKTNNLYQALTNFDWINMKLGDRKSYYIIVTYMKKEFSINTAVGSDLSLITMTAVSVL